jgi:arginase
MATSRPTTSGPIRAAPVAWLEGIYLTLRPSFGEKDSIYAYRTEIVWDAAASCLIFREAERTDAAYAQFGEVAVPNQSGHIYLVTNRHGQHRLITVSRPTITGEMYGIIATLLCGPRFAADADRGADRVPADQERHRSDLRAHLADRRQLPGLSGRAAAYHRRAVRVVRLGIGAAARMDGSDQRSESPARILAVIGAPIEDAERALPGTVMGPAALRTAGLIRTLRDLGNEVDDRGDLRLEERVPEPVLMAGSARNIASVAGWARMLRRETYAAMKNGRVPIVLGGDHSLSIGSVSGVLQYCAEAGRTLFVLWLDAHADFNTPATSPSGNLHGMSAAWLCGEPGLPISEEPRAILDPKNLHLFGVRAVDRGERDLLQARGVNIVDMRQLDEFGASVLMRRIIDAARGRNGLIHVSLDVDFLDPQLAPGAGTTVPGGATFREAHLVMEMLHDCGNGRLARRGRAQSVPRRARQERAAAGRSRGEPVRPPDHRAAGVRRHCRPMTSEILTVGHSSHSPERFIVAAAARRRRHGRRRRAQRAIYSRHAPQFNRDPLRDDLAVPGSPTCSSAGSSAAGRADASSMRTASRDYEKMAQAPAFAEGLERVIEGAQSIGLR